MQHFLEKNHTRAPSDTDIPPHTLTEPPTVPDTLSSSTVIFTPRTLVVYICTDTRRMLDRKTPSNAKHAHRCTATEESAEKIGGQHGEDGRSCCAGLGFFETTRPSAPRLPIFFFLARPLGFPMVLACVFRVFGRHVCAFVVCLLPTTTTKKSPIGTAQQNVEYLEKQIFPGKTQKYTPRD